MARRIEIRFLDPKRERAEVTIENRPSWLAWLFGRRSWKQTTTVGYETYGPNWRYEIDGRAVDDNDVVRRLDWERRWSVVKDGQLPQATLVKDGT
jgi:hypothetical protein